MKSTTSQKNFEQVSTFGSVVISTAFQGLTLDSLGQTKLSQGILKAFDINTNYLNQLKNEEEKREYISNQMNTVINQLLKSWDDKLFLKEQKYKDQDKQIKSDKNDNRQKHFKWLQLRTKYERLKNKLRQIVIDKLNDYENQQLALKSHGRQIMLKNVQIVTTRNIFENMEKYGKSNEFHFLKSLGQERLKQIREKSQHKKQNEDQMADQILDVQWNDQKEQIFLNQRSSTKQLFTNEVSSSNWNDLGFLPILQQMTLQEKKKTQREHIMNKYDEGEFLTAQELQFLANTSDLLNACLDKEFLQKSTNLINKELLSNMELQLAEQILKDFEEMKQATMKARLNYIRQKMTKTKSKLVEKLDVQSRVQDFEQHMDVNRKYIKMYTTVINHMDRLHKFEEKIPEDIPGAQLLKEYLFGRLNDRQYIIKLKQIVNDKLRRKKSQSYDILEISSQKQELVSSKQSMKRMEYIHQMARPKSSATPHFITDIKRHTYHPSTKVFVNKKNDDDQSIEFINQAKLQFNKREEEKYKLGLKSHPALKMPHNFKKFYSGGPQQYAEGRFLYNRPLEEPTQREIRAATVIQRKLRALIREKKLRSKIEERRKQIFYFFKDSCDNIMQQALVDRPDQSVQNFMITKQLEKCKEIAKEALNFGKVQKLEESSIIKKGLKTGTSLYSTDASTPKSQNIFKFCVSRNKVKVDYLFQAAQKGRLMMMIQSKFVYSSNDVNSQNMEGDTALHIVVRGKNKDFAEWLLQNGANPYVLNGLSQTPYDLAHGQNNMLRLFQMYSF
ncbi:hypothetical protein pb186bvf_013236 [Paramecium bursaria]